MSRLSRLLLLLPLLASPALADKPIAARDVVPLAVDGIPAIGSPATQLAVLPLALDLCPQDKAPGGVAGFVWYLANGYSCRVTAGGCVPLMTGNLLGPIFQAMTNRIAADTDQRDVGFAEYSGNGKRLITVFSGTVTGGPGLGCVSVSEFATLFLHSVTREGALVAEVVARPKHGF